MATRQYVGARYVPKFYDYNGSSAWRSGTEYEALTIVTVNGNSYTSKIPVPSSVGSPDQNPEYWVATGLYNEQVEAYRQLTLALSGRVDDVEDGMSTLRDDLEGDMSTLRSDLEGDMSTLRSDLEGDISTLRNDLEGDMSDLRTDVDNDIEDVTLAYKVENGKIVSPFLGYLGAIDISGDLQGGYAVGNTIFQYIASGATGHFRSINIEFSTT